jgi:hypothetical protein
LGLNESVIWVERSCSVRTRTVPKKGRLLK